MNWKKALGFAVLIWIAVFVIASIFVALGMPSGSMTFNLILAVLSLVVVYLAAKRIAPATSGIAIQYGLIFAVVGIILDFIITTKFAPNIFSTTSYWVSYILGVFVPIFAVKKNS